MFDYTQIALGLGLSTTIGGLAFRRGSLTASGWIGAVLVGTLTFGFGGWDWGLTLIVFFLTSSALSHYKESLKERRAAEKFAKGGRRDILQVLANGGLGALVAAVYAVSGRPPELQALFIGLMATVTADTWATELGVLSTQPPRMIHTGKLVTPGTSGGVTLFGTSASAAGALLIGSAAALFALVFNPAAGAVWWMLPAAAIGGLIGSLTDSLLGATVQAIYVYPDGRETERKVARDGRPTTFHHGWRWLDNDLVNLISSIVGAVATMLLAGLFGAW
jgi:uncharacterized protein (TIGR00297 family)